MSRARQQADREPSGSGPAGPEPEGADPGGMDRDELVDAVTELRAAVRDLKHDIRMLKVGLDKQNRMLAQICGEDDEVSPLRFGDRPSRGSRDVSGGHLSAG